MQNPFVRDKKLLWLLTFLLLAIIIMAMIWEYYDIELQALEQQKNELKLKK